METFERLRTSVQIQRVTLHVRERCGPRIVLSVMVFVGFTIAGIIENSITVDLLRGRGSLSQVANMSSPSARRYCDPPNMTALAIYYDSSEDLDDDIDYDFSQIQEMDFQVPLTHNEAMESILKKAYLWGNLVSPLPASRLAANIGPKRVFGYGLLGAGAATLLVPAAWLKPAHMVIRFAQGLFFGAMLPSAHMLAVNWFPPRKRTSFLSLYSGTYLGYALSDLLTITFMTALGHDSIFYIMSMMVISWFVMWSLLVFNCPRKHPRLSKEVKRCLEAQLDTTHLSEPLSLPWRHVLCSRPVWMSVAVMFGTYVGQTTVNIALKQYLTFVYNIPDSALRTTPCILHCIFAFFCGYLADYIREVGLVSTTTVRRIFVYISHFIPASLIFVVGFVGCDSTAPIILYSLALISHGACYSGAFASSIDVAPNHAGSIFGLSCTFGVVGSLVTSYVVSLILNGLVPGSWRMSFSLCALTLLVSSIIFMLRGSGSVQMWNIIPIATQKAQLYGKEPFTSLSDDPSTLLKAKHKIKMEGQLFQVLLVQEPEKITRVRAHSTSSPDRLGENEKSSNLSLNKKRASIS